MHASVTMAPTAGVSPLPVPSSSARQPDAWPAVQAPDSTPPHVVVPTSSPPPLPPLAGDVVHVRLRSDAQTVLVVPAADLRHLPTTATTAIDCGGGPLKDALPMPPPPPRRAPPLFLCDAYTTLGACPAGAACPNVHAVTANSRRLHEHRRIAAGNERTPRLGPRGLWLMVARVNERASSMIVEASRCLSTLARPQTLPPGPWPSTPRGSEEPLAPAPGLCAHFVKKGVCNFGAECRFVHPLSHPKPVHSWKAASPPPVSLVSSPEASPPPPPPPRRSAAGQQPLPPSSTGGPIAQHGGGGHDGSAPTIGTSALVDASRRRRYWHNPYGQGWSAAPTTPPPASPVPTVGGRPFTAVLPAGAVVVLSAAPFV